jgi:hypothetical protein
MMHLHITQQVITTSKTQTLSYTERSAAILIPAAPVDCILHVYENDAHFLNLKITDAHDIYNRIHVSLDRKIKRTCKFILLNRQKNLSCEIWRQMQPRCYPCLPMTDTTSSQNFWNVKIIHLINAKLYRYRLGQALRGSRSLRLQNF